MTDGQKLKPEQLQKLYEASLIKGAERWRTCCPEPDFALFAAMINKQMEENQLDDFEASH